jgi:hypothetical protein
MADTVTTAKVFDDAGGVLLKDSELHSKCFALFSEAKAHVVRTQVAIVDSPKDKKVVGVIPTELVSALCKDIVEVTDDIGDLQLLGIL